MIKLIIQSVRQVVVWTLLTGIAYPVIITVISQAAFKDKANGSVISSGTNEIGSELLAQQFTGTNYFWPRPSSGTYATVPSGASNLGPTSGALKTNVQAFADGLRTAHNLATNAEVPADLVFTSGSGVDPHISPEAAVFQINRVATSRMIPTDKIHDLVNKFIEAPQYGFLGEPRVNVLKLNLELDRQFPKP